MKIPNFKLKFQTSQITNFSTPIITEKILEKLQKKKYEVRNITDNSITFRWNPFRLVWNFQAPYLLNGGDFEITKSEQGTIVVLNYFINTFYSLLIITALITNFIIQGDYLGVLFFGTFYLLAGTYQYMTTKKVGRELLSNILAEDY